MTISMNQIPNDLRVPLAYMEFDNSRAVAGTPAMSFKILILGQRLADSSVAAGVPTRIVSDSQAEDAFGRGSMLAEMCKAAVAVNRYTETWAIALDDDGAGTAASGSLALVGPASRNGTLNLYIAGKQVRAGVVAGDTAETVAAAVAAAVNANDTLPVTAEVNGGDATQVDFSARHKGEFGNDIDLRLNLYQGEVTPAGLTTTITAMDGGTANPDIDPAIAAMGDEWWNHLAMPYTNASNLTLLETELIERWGPLKMKDCMAWSGYRGTLAQTGTFGNTRNNQLVSYMGTNIAGSPPYIWAAVDAAVAAYFLNIDPARPLQTLPLRGIVPAAREDQWPLEDRNTLLHDGISTHTVGPDGVVRIERMVTSYQTNAYGVSDPSYLDATTLATLAYLRYAWVARITQKFPRHKLREDGDIPAGQAIVTPSTLRGELITMFLELEQQGLVENVEQFKADLVVEINANDENRADALIPPDLVNQLRVFAAQIQFRL